MTKYNGLALSPGLELGTLCFLQSPCNWERKRIAPDEIDSELEKLDASLQATRQELLQLKSRLDQNVGGTTAEILDFQILLTKDPYLINPIHRKITIDCKQAGWALEETLEEIRASINNLKDIFFRERFSDFLDLGNRVLQHINECRLCSYWQTAERLIIAARTLLPSQTVDLPEGRVIGFITQRGGVTGHAAILARSMGIPLVSGIYDLFERGLTGDPIILDGYRGAVIHHPSGEQLESYQRVKEILLKRKALEKADSAAPAITLDGLPIHLLANINSDGDVPQVLQMGAEGVGLYRTELHYLHRMEFADEEEQYQNYKKIALQLSGAPFVIRTLDIGGDKLVPGDFGTKEPNPNLGYRAIRISLREPGLFAAQLRAIYRSALYGAVQVLFPMVSSLEQVVAIKKIINEVVGDLQRAGIPCREKIPMGIMIEIPSAAIRIDSFLQEVDFVSVGTNDLIQYTLAVDRGNEVVSELYQPADPAVLHLLAQIGRAAHKAGKEASICGEMAGDPLYTELLLGLGFRRLSMSPAFIEPVKARIRHIDLADAEKFADRLLGCRFADEVQIMLERRIHDILVTNTDL
ncbi:phosphoenolpyruvate--protein phosphotransferase [candidate division KSB1 bacterium]|nr:phosphoenolpyruvate--protein phosphotransferase [candidate division KSB1 bacterium]